MKKILLIVTFISLFVFIGTGCDENKVDEFLDNSKTNETQNEKSDEENEEKDTNSETEEKKDNEQDKNINDEAVKKANEGKQLAFDFTLNDLNGNEVKLSSLRGRKVWVNIWATWCSPCRREMPDLDRVNKEVDKNDLVILTINSGESKATAEKFVKDNNYSFTVLLDESKKVANMYSVRGIPTSIFINKDGYITDRISGALPYDKMIEYIENIK